MDTARAAAAECIVGMGAVQARAVLGPELVRRQPRRSVVNIFLQLAFADLFPRRLHWIERSHNIHRHGMAV